MTREELRDYVDEQRGLGNIPYHVYSTLIDKIDTLEQQPSEDCISRQALDEIKELMTDINGDTVYAVRMSNIRQLPSVTPQPKVGEWLKNGELCKCSNCHSNVLFSAVKLYNYCYRCGAKMEAEE